MIAQNLMMNTADPDGRSLYRAGGIAALAYGIANIIIITLYVPMGAAPSGAEARLTYLAGYTTSWWAIVGLSVLTDFLLVPIALSLYLALKGIDRNAMLAAAACMALFIVLDLGLTWTNHAALITLSGHYTVATSEAERAAFVAAAIYPSTVVESNLLFVYNTLTLSVGILLIGFVMLRGIFNKATAYLGIVTGIIGIIAVVGPIFVSALSATIILASVLTTIWALLVGYGLYRLSQQHSLMYASSPSHA